MIQVGIVGAAGYTAGELLRILIHHPHVHIVWAHSHSNAGKKISDVHTDLIGETNLFFDAQLSLENIHVLFLCMGHGKSIDFIKNQSIPSDIKIIDLSTDFRHRKSASIGNRPFIYGLPELNHLDITKAHNIANPGCFATCIQLGLLPLAHKQWIQNDVHIHAITGSTGAGQAPSTTGHFSWRNNNISIYKAFKHQHLKEIRESIQQLQHSFDYTLNFLPLRGNFTRGIFASIYTEINAPIDEIIHAYISFYKDAPFVHITQRDISLKEVINTNKAILKIEKHEGKVLITSIIDNLLKGASGQAVENMNLLFGRPQKEGLHLKSIGF